MTEQEMLKAIRAKDKEIENLKSHIKQLETGFDKQTKEIDLRNDWIKKRDEYALSLLQRIEADSIEIQRLKSEI